MLTTSGFVDNFTFSHNGPYGASRVIMSGRKMAYNNLTRLAAWTVARIISGQAR